MTVEAPASGGDKTVIVIGGQRPETRDSVGQEAVEWQWQGWYTTCDSYVTGSKT